MSEASRVELHVEELILHGVAPRDQDAVAHAFSHELTRLLTEQGIPEDLSSGIEGQHVPFLDAGMLDARPGTAPTLLGTRAARLVYAGMGGEIP
jgi:hypothetical protein